ncbi:hypothetical protein IMY05_017G0108700 [Salix suchowensis]|nr:hypothetical protein IMY05_017G0108700 [Salix suchowensis]
MSHVTCTSNGNFENSYGVEVKGCFDSFTLKPYILSPPKVFLSISIRTSSSLFWAPDSDQQTKAMVMDVSRAIQSCSSIPLLGCVLGTIFHLFTSYDSTSERETVTGGADHQAAASNRAAQKHFQQIQHIRGA